VELTKEKIEGNALYQIPVDGIIKALEETAHKEILQLSDIEMSLKNMNGAFEKVSTKGNIHYSFNVQYNEPIQKIRLSLETKIKNLPFQLEPYYEVFDTASIMGVKAQVPKEIYLYFMYSFLKKLNKSVKQMNKFINSKVNLKSRFPNDLINSLVDKAKTYAKKTDKLTQTVAAASMADIKYVTIAPERKFFYDVFCEPQWGNVNVKGKYCVKGLTGQILLLDRQLYAYEEISRSEIVKSFKNDISKAERGLRTWNRKFRK